MRVHTVLPEGHDPEGQELGEWSGEERDAERIRAQLPSEHWRWSSPTWCNRPARVGDNGTEQRSQDNNCANALEAYAEEDGLFVEDEGGHEQGFRALGPGPEAVGLEIEGKTTKKHTRRMQSGPIRM